MKVVTQNYQKKVTLFKKYLLLKKGSSFETVAVRKKHPLRKSAQYVKYRISPNFLVWKFFGKAQFPHSFRRLV